MARAKRILPGFFLLKRRKSPPIMINNQKKGRGRIILEKKIRICSLNN